MQQHEEHDQDRADDADRRPPAGSSMRAASSRGFGVGQRGDARLRVLRVHAARLKLGLHVGALEKLVNALALHQVAGADHAGLHRQRQR